MVKDLAEGFIYGVAFFSFAAWSWIEFLQALEMSIK